MEITSAEVLGGVPAVPTAAASTTTREQDRHTLGQRRVNLLWESTQAIIALSVIGTTLYIDGIIAVHGKTMTELQSSALMQLNVMAALVTGFYFGRTNHQRVGGVDIGR
jgi:hypothetical protein